MLGTRARPCMRTNGSSVNGDAPPRISPHTRLIPRPQRFTCTSQCAAPTHPHAPARGGFPGRCAPPPAAAGSGRTPARRSAPPACPPSSAAAPGRPARAAASTAAPAPSPPKTGLPAALCTPGTGRAGLSNDQSAARGHPPDREGGCSARAASKPACWAVRCERGGQSCAAAQRWSSLVDSKLI